MKYEIIKQHEKMFNRQWIDSCRESYLKEIIQRDVEKILYLMNSYENSLKNKEDIINQIYIKEGIDDKINKIRKNVTELYISKCNYSNESTNSDREQSMELFQRKLDRAREYDFSKLLGSGGVYHRCPFHLDTKPSMVLKNNKVTCYSCNKTWDTIQFVMDRDGLTFREAVEMLS